MSYQQDIYEVQNKDRYIGKKNPRYLSSYELRMFDYLDRHDDIIKWGAECVVVPYFNPVKAAKSGGSSNPNKPNARYIIDIYVKYRDKDDNIQEELIEIKPLKEVKHVLGHKPKKGRKKTSTYQREIEMAIINEAKWKAAKAFADARGMKFKVITERQLWRS